MKRSRDVEPNEFGTGIGSVLFASVQRADVAGDRYVSGTQQICHLQNLASISRRIAQTIDLLSFEPKNTRHTTRNRRSCLLHRIAASRYQPDPFFEPQGTGRKESTVLAEAQTCDECDVLTYLGPLFQKIGESRYGVDKQCRLAVNCASEVAVRSLGAEFRQVVS
jgi:hypothetical protein